jgi:hypothetical protein
LNLGTISKVPGLSEDFVKLAKGLNEKTITEDAAKELLNSGKDKWVNFVSKYGKPILNGTKEDLKGAATMAYFGAVDKINRMAFGDPNTKAEDILPDAGKSFVDGVFAMIPYGFVKGMTPTNNPNSSMKGFINDMARFPDSVEDIFKLSEMSESERNSKIQILNTAVSMKNAVAATEAEMKIDLQPTQRAVLVANKTVEAILRDKATRTTDDTIKNKTLSQADQLRDQSSNILNGLQFNDTLEPKTEQFVAEQEYNQAVQEGDLPKIEAAKIKLEEETDNASITPFENKQNVISVNEVIDKPVVYKSQDGSLQLDGKTVLFKVSGQEKEYEIGNVDEIGNTSIKEHGIEQNNSVVSSHDNGNIVVRDKEYVNNFSDPLAAINRNSKGEIVSVNLETPEGKKVTFRNNIAEDVAYQIHLKEITKDNETREQFEQFASNQPPAEDSNIGTNTEITEEGTVANNAQVPDINNQGDETEAGLSQSGIDKADSRKVYAEIRNIDEPTDARGLALAYLAHGGRVSEESINDTSGTTKAPSLNTGIIESKSNEVKSRDYYEKNGGTIDQIAHSIWDNLPEHLQENIDTQDIKNELQEVINNHNTRLSAAQEYLKAYRVEEPIFANEEQISEEEQRLNDYLNSQSQNEYEPELISDNEIFNIINNEIDNQTEDQQSSAENKGSGNKANSNYGGKQTSETEIVPPGYEPPTIDKSEQQGIRISKQGIFDQYGKLFEKTKVGWNEVTKNALNRLREDAEEKNTTVDAEAKFQVDQMAVEINKNKLSVSEDKITTATVHLINTDERIDSLQKQKATTPQERSSLAIQLETAIAERENTLMVLDALGTKSGRNLGLFAGVFSKIDDGGITIARRRVEGYLGMEIPQTEKELDANEKMSPWQKNKVRPFVKRIEEIKREYEEKLKEIESKNENTANVKKERKKTSDSVRKFANKIRNSETLDKIGLGKPIQGDTKGFTFNVKENLADALDFIADGLDKGEELIKLVKDATAAFKGKNNETEFKNLIDLAIGNLPEVDRNAINSEIPFDVKEDILNEEREIIRKKTLGQLNQLSRQAEDNNRKWYSKALDWRRSFLIGGIKTLGRVSISGVSKFIVDPIAKQTTGRITSLLPGLSNESASVKSTVEGWGSLIKFKDNKSALNYVADKQAELENASKKLEKSNNVLEGLDKKFGKSSNDYQQYNITEHRKIQQVYQNAELENAKAAIYKWINGNGFKDFKDLFKYGSTDFEQSMGGYNKINTSLLSKGDKILYYIEAMNRLHAVAKNSSARRALVETYNSKLENYQKSGIPLITSTRMRALDMAYGEFLSGKYQEKTQVNDIINKTKNEGNRTNASTAQKIWSSFVRIALPVAKVGINITKTGFDMSSVGLEGILRYGYEVNKGIKLNKEQGLQYKNVWNQFIAGAEAIPAKDKSYINKVLSRGLFGLALMAYTATAIANGSIQYGGEYDDKHKAKRKYKDINGKWHELDYGEWVINGVHMGKFGSSVLNHLPEFLPIAMVVNTHNVYQYEHEYRGIHGKKKFKDVSDSYKEALLSDINEVWERLPFANVLKPLDVANNLVSFSLVKDISEYFDKDKKGNLIERKPNGIVQQAEMNIGLRQLVDQKKKKK